MVSLEMSDFIAMKDFGFAWRITDPRWTLLPDATLDRIKPLSESLSQRLYARSPLCLPWRDPLDLRRLRVTKEKSLAESGPTQDADCRRWFRELPIEPTEPVYVCWANEGGIAAVTDWGTFTAVWDDLWYPFDWMCVFDDTGEWVVLFGPEETVRFAEKAIKEIGTTTSPDPIIPR